MAETRGFCAEHSSQRIPCIASGCPRFGVGGTGSTSRYCAVHGKTVRRGYEKQRPSSAKRGYGSAWRKLRAEILKANPVCPCGAAATVVDHVIPKRAGGADAPANLRALCKSCHSSKTTQSDGGLGNPRWRR